MLCIFHVSGDVDIRTICATQYSNKAIWVRNTNFIFLRVDIILKRKGMAYIKGES